MTIASLIVDVAANTVKLQQDVNRIQGSLDGVTSYAAKVGTALAGAFTITAVTGAASKILQYAGNIKDLSEQTGLTTKTIQEMRHAANLGGTSLESFTNAAFKLGVNLAGGGNSVHAALGKMGLSLEALRQMSPDEQFHAIAKALAGVANVQERNALGLAVMGKGYQQISASIGDYIETAKRAVVVGDDQLTALDQTSKAFDSFTEGAMNLGVHLAGGLVIAIQEAMRWFESMTGVVASVKKGFEAWGDALEYVGLRTSALPKVAAQLTETGRVAANLPQPIRQLSASFEDQEQVMKALSAQHARTALSSKSIGVAQSEVNPQVQRLTDSFNAQIEAFRRTNTLANSVMESFRLMRVELRETIPVLQNLTTNGFEPFKATVEQNKTTLTGWGAHARDIFGGVPQSIMNAIQGGGSIIGAAGASIGTSLMTKFSEKFGPAIKSALPFGIGEAVTALLPTLGALFGPVAEKIGGFFKSIFGGPSAEELRGRQAVADFEAQLAGLLTQTQRNEAGNESWKATVIAIRDAYILAGKTEAEALAAAENLWKSSKAGAGATEAAIAAIRAVMDSVGTSASTTANALNDAFRDRSFTIDETRNISENIYRNVFEAEGTGEGYALGTKGMTGSFFQNFGAGRRVTLHGEEAVVRKDQAGAFADEFGGGSEGLDMIRQMVRDLPRAMKVAVEDAMLLKGAR